MQTSKMALAEAATLYLRIAQRNPRYKDVAFRAKELSLKQKHPANGKGGGASNRSWIGNAIVGFNQLIGGRK